jgi:hypothetical protein
VVRRKCPARARCLPLSMERQRTIDRACSRGGNVRIMADRPRRLSRSREVRQFARGGTPVRQTHCTVDVDRACVFRRVTPQLQKIQARPREGRGVETRASLLLSTGYDLRCPDPNRPGSGLLCSEIDNVTASSSGALRYFLILTELGLAEYALESMASLRTLRVVQSNTGAET